MLTGMHKSSLVYRGIFLLALIVVLTVCIAVLTACDPSAQLTVENRIPTDVKIIHESIDEQGSVFLEEELGMVPAQQTAKMRYELFLRPGVIGDTITLKAVGEAGDIVWQRSWSFEEFLKLKEVGWKVVVSAETGS